MAFHYLGVPGGFQDEGDWETDKAYLVRNCVANTIATVITTYYCSVAHTSSAATEPGVGASWTSYWVLTTEIIDQIRTAYGDTDSDNPLCTDEQLLYFYYDVTDEEIYGAAACACDKLAAQFAREVDMADGEISAKMSQKSKRYQAMADALRDQQSAEDGFALAVAARETTRDPAFTLDQFTYGNDRKLEDGEDEDD